MDISKPLPDVPLLEPYRRFDKTTREYDERVGRDPNKWRNYDQEQYNKEAKEILKKVESYHKEQKRLYS
jgi:phosphohistidine phosphatase SixA